ncbi:MAG: hypothetical protein KHZ78_05375 [Peptoniphilus sp. oral taxon 375]|nr:hypothetical protein [Peptoniphilus sp. oral taxon 375]
MKNKRLVLRSKDKVRMYFILIYRFMEFEINNLTKKYETGEISKDYLDGYTQGVYDLNNMLMETDISILKEEKE